MFNIELIHKSPIINDDKISLPLKSYEDSQTIINLICDRMEESSKFKFLVQGFGLDDWKTDVRTDLAIVIEQLPIFIPSFLKKENNIELNFYEQGIERDIFFYFIDEIVEIKCLSYSSWIPSPAVENVAYEKVLNMFKELLNTYIDSAAKLWYAAYSSSFFDELKKTAELLHFSI